MKALKLLLVLVAIVALVAACGPKPGKIDLKPKKVTLKAVDATKKVTADVFDAQSKKMENHKPVVWTSSDPSVATVGADGEVKAVASGEATITAALGDVTASTPVKVRIVASITLDKQTLDLKVSESQLVNATVKDEKGNDLTGEPVKFTAADKTIVKTVGKGKITGLKAGQTVVTASSGVGDKAVKADVTVNVTGEAPKEEPKDVKGKDDKKAGAKIVPMKATKKVEKKK